MANEIQPISTSEGEIVLYQPDENISLEVKLDAVHETVWLTQQQIADLFGVKQPAISKHLNNIFKSGNLIRLQFIPFWNILQQMVRNTRHNSIISMLSSLLVIVSIVSMQQPFADGLPTFFVNTFSKAMPSTASSSPSNSMSMTAFYASKIACNRMRNR